MLFSNETLKATEVTMDFGTLYQVSMGEKGRGRHEIRLCVPSKDTVIEKGLNMELSVGTTKSGRPRVISQMNNDLYLLLTTKGNYTRRGCGQVWIWNKNTAKYIKLAQGNGADGDAGRIGFWMCYLLKMEAEGTPENDWILIRRGGWRHYDWLHISSKGVFYFDSTQKAMDFADSIDVDFPNLDFEYDEENGKINQEDFTPAGYR